MSETKTSAPSTYAITDDTRTAIMQCIASKPFNTVFGITKAIEKDLLSEEEANAIINAMGQFPYAEVAEFFSKVQELFVPIEAPAEVAKPVKKAKKPALKKA